MKTITMYSSKQSVIKTIEINLNNGNCYFGNLTEDINIF